jgi:hypothetical protein
VQYKCLRVFVAVDDDVAESVHCSTDDGFILVTGIVKNWCRK